MTRRTWCWYQDCHDSVEDSTPLVDRKTYCPLHIGQARKQVERFMATARKRLATEDKMHFKTLLRVLQREMYAPRKYEFAFVVRWEGADTVVYSRRDVQHIQTYNKGRTVYEEKLPENPLYRGPLAQYWYVQLGGNAVHEYANE